MSKKKTHEEYVVELAIKNPNIQVVEKYKGANTSILHRCLTDDYIWLATPSNILRGHGCPMCAGNVKKTTEQYKTEVSKIHSNIEIVEEYVSANIPIAHRCKIDGYEWQATPTSVLGGNGCAICAGNKKKTTEEYAQELVINNLNIEVLGQYVGATIPILHRCKIDGHEWFITPANVLSGRGCPKCKSHILHNEFKKSHEEYVHQLFVTNSDLEVVGEYINAKTPILHKCKIDGYEWCVAPINVLSGQGCPCCQESKGERQVRQWLEKRKIIFIYQKTFTGCEDKKKLPFDFYISKYNVCIEYDGKQHFEPIDFAGNGKKWALQQFKKTTYHDEIKTQYCKDNNIHLLRIPYYKNVQEELDKFFIHLI